MKKQMKKLTLAKETLWNLDEGKLEKVVGASDGSARQCGLSQCIQCINTYTTCATSASKYC